jgi:Trypsin
MSALTGRRLRRSIPMVFLLVLAVALVLGPSSASAITYGVPDGVGHPGVGALVAEFNGQKDWLCTGTLISPTIFLTAAHCTAYLQSIGITKVWVTFDEEFDAVNGSFVPGVIHTNSGYNHRQSDTGDMAVIVLDKAQDTRPPAQLPTAGQFDLMAAKNGLKGQTFRAVGYGTQQTMHTVGKPFFGPGGTRMTSVSTFDAITDAWLHLSGNPAKGDGGTGYGDSGGPNYLGETNVIAGLTVTGDTMCRATNVIYRLDTPVARAFLSEFVALP